MSSLKDADAIINGERQDQYGSPEDSFKIIGDFWNVYIRARFSQLKHVDFELTPLDVAHMMSLFKHARMLGQKVKRDNYIDAQGYLAIAADRLIEEPSDKEQAIYDDPMSKTAIIQTYTGRMIDILNPKKDDIVLYDIAQSLAYTNRFSGHTIFPYSVAQHSIAMAFKGGDPVHSMHLLMHDADETYLSDVPAPIKKHIENFSEIESNLIREIYASLLPELYVIDLNDTNIKEIDKRMCVTEAKVLFKGGINWESEFEPYDYVSIFNREDPVIVVYNFIDIFNFLKACIKSADYAEKGKNFDFCIRHKSGYASMKFNWK